jgi:hypothetical protein
MHGHTNVKIVTMHCHMNVKNVATHGHINVKFVYIGIKSEISCVKFRTRSQFLTINAYNLYLCCSIGLVISFPYQYARSLFYWNFPNIDTGNN